MGRKDKHKLGGSRNDAVFKVVGAKVNKGGKGKPKSVNIKVKKVVHDKSKSDIANLDAKLKTIQHQSIKFNGKTAAPKGPSKIEPVKTSVNTPSSKDIDSLIEGMETSVKSK